MTHDDALSQIMQAVHAANAGNNQELHRLASVVMDAHNAQEDQAQDGEDDDTDAPVPLAATPQAVPGSTLEARLPLQGDDEARMDGEQAQY